MILTEEQLEGLDNDGFVAPLRLYPAEEMAGIRRDVDAATRRGGPHHGDPWSARHQDSRVVYDLCAHPQISEAVAQVLGHDLLIWNSVLMNKAPGDGEIPWHQDHDFLYLQPDVGLAVWLALDDTGPDNGCLEVVAGSHRSILPSVARTRPEDFDSHVERSQLTGEPVPVELQAGEFMLFHNKILHRSGPNTSDRRRLGLAVRYTVSGVSVDEGKMFDGYRVYPVRGAASAHLDVGVMPPHE